MEKFDSLSDTVRNQDRCVNCDRLTIDKFCSEACANEWRRMKKAEEDCKD